MGLEGIMGRYFVAMRSGHGGGRTVAERLHGVPGVVIKGASNPNRILIESSPEVAESLRRTLGDGIIVEREMTFRPSRTSGFSF